METDLNASQIGVPELRFRGDSREDTQRSREKTRRNALQFEL